LELLRQSAEEYPNTAMQEMANITWADGQVWNAARHYIYNREEAMEALGRATSAYTGILQTSKNERLINRAHLGLGRVYEMQGELEKAREEYRKVQGGFTAYARDQAERLETPEAKEAYAWLSTARPPRTTPPAGPGKPGEEPEFSTGEFPLPGEAPDAGATEGASESFEEVLKRFDLGFPKEGEKEGEADRYEGSEEAPPKDGAPPLSTETKQDVQEAPPEEE
jgi:hypothetical protein